MRGPPGPGLRDLESVGLTRRLMAKDLELEELRGKWQALWDQPEPPSQRGRPSGGVLFDPSLVVYLPPGSCQNEKLSGGDWKLSDPAMADRSCPRESCQGYLIGRSVLLIISPQGEGRGRSHEKKQRKGFEPLPDCEKFVV